MSNEIESRSGTPFKSEVEPRTAKTQDQATAQSESVEPATVKSAFAKAHELYVDAFIAEDLGYKEQARTLQAQADAQNDLAHKLRVRNRK